jgi:hypothetical protein
LVIPLSGEQLQLDNPGNPWRSISIWYNGHMNSRSYSVDRTVFIPTVV